MFNVDKIPEELKKRRQWVCCDKNKVPRTAGTWEKASSTNNTTWRTFEEAIQAFNSGGYSGIGFVFTKDDPYCFIDLDKCFDSDTGEVADWALGIIGLVVSNGQKRTILTSQVLLYEAESLM